VYRLSTPSGNESFPPKLASASRELPCVPDSVSMTAIGRIPPLLIALFAVAVALVSTGRSNADSRWVWPIVGEVVHGFERPATAWAAGHRGIDIQALPGSEVRAPVAGLVTFVGPVAGRGVIVLRTLEDDDVTLEPIEPAVVLGDVVNAGDIVGFVRGGHLGRNALHLGIRVKGEYVDPIPFLPLQPRIVVYDSWLDSYALG
jgi:murein DD-endopeptidase MepM/ murein hydrolase activator NlpD